MIQVFEYMQSKATSERALEFFQFDVSQDVEYISVWRGKTQDIATDLNIGYHLVSDAIKNLCWVESIIRVYKGTHGHPSIYHIVEPPDQNKFLQQQEFDHRVGRMKSLTPEQRMDDKFNSLVNRVIALEEKLERLERRVATNEKIRDAHRRY